MEHAHIKGKLRISHYQPKNWQKIINAVWTKENGRDPFCVHIKRAGELVADPNGHNVAGNPIMVQT